MCRCGGTPSARRDARFRARPGNALRTLPGTSSKRLLQSRTSGLRPLPPFQGWQVFHVAEADRHPPDRPRRMAWTVPVRPIGPPKPAWVRSARRRCPVRTPDVAVASSRLVGPRPPRIGERRRDVSRGVVYGRSRGHADTVGVLNGPCGERGDRPQRGINHVGARSQPNANPVLAASSPAAVSGLGTGRRWVVDVTCRRHRSRRRRQTS